MWTRCLPHVRKIVELVQSGVLGDLRTVSADHGQWFEPDPEHRLFAPGLGGGALLDLGIYPVSFVHLLLGHPTQVTAVSDPAFTGVDGQTTVTTQHAGGAHGIATTTLWARTPTRAFLAGTLGAIEVHPDFYRPSSCTLQVRGAEPQTYRFDVPGHGLRYEAAEFGRCLRSGLTESPLMPLDETVQIMQVLDGARRQVGLVYDGQPGEPARS